MSVGRLIPKGLRIEDADGDVLDVEPMRTGVALFTISTQGVIVDRDDGLALLSFLADALGVERYVPGGGA